MPRFPNVAATSTTLSARVFSDLAARAQEKKAAGEVVLPLHVGDTYEEPPEGCRAENQVISNHPGLHQYAPPRGMPSLIDAVAERLAELGREVPKQNIQVVSGATSGLHVIAEALLEPGDEVLLPSPFWPLIRGIISGRGATPVQVPIMHRLGEVDIEGELEARVTERTVALYLNTPHNPTGAMLSAAQADAFVRVAKRHSLWLICDEAYQDIYFGETPSPIWTRDDVQEQYVACHTLSKSYGLAGARVAYAHGAPSAMRAIRGVQTFSTYCAARPMQLAGANALRLSPEFLAGRRVRFAKAAQTAASAFGLAAPPGGTFLFFDASPYLRESEENALPFLSRCLEAGVMLTPGAACGEGFENWVRLCFTGVDPSTLEDALGRLAPLLNR